MFFRRVVFWSVLPTWVWAGTGSAGEPIAAPHVEWHVDAAFTQALTRPVGLTWEQTPLREGLHELARRQRVAIMLDRRLDPGRLVDFASGGLLPFRQLMARLAATLDAEIGIVGSVIYVGPPPVSKLATLVALRQETLRTEMPQRVATWSTRRPWSWPRLSQPRQLLAQLATAYQTQIGRLDAIPLDLWPAYDLPPLDGVEALTLLLAGFNATFEWQPDGGVQLVPLPDEIWLERDYAVPRQPAKLSALRADFPDTEIRWADARLTIRGTVEAHEQIAARLRGETPPEAADPSTRQTVFTLTVRKKPLGAVLKTIERQTEFRFEIPAEVAPLMSRNIDVDVKDETLESLLRKSLDPLGLQFRIEGKRIELFQP